MQYMLVKVKMYERLLFTRKKLLITFISTMGIVNVFKSVNVNNTKSELTCLYPSDFIA